MHYVAILHEIVLALEAQLSMGFGRCLRAGGEQRVPVDGFGANEMFLEVGVDGSGRLLRPRINRDCPGAALVLAYGEKADEAKQLIALANQAPQAAFLEAV